ncbi:hypothetical protein A3842_11110 [Paenibacillus sp. P3E]|uniref:BC1872 family protein n=1 Tax=Paenibacillus sp. P3E TaxID=1349435 RepID=UPI0009399EFF|nr:hypothetical protein [Paenibacillus sp. P3E]OKP81620.1 hypothetical protein A3842_11110 [Paenibacillus sp. P3E]
MTLTREEIQGIKPGRELDALIAKEVFGWHYGPYHTELRKYSTHIVAAWEVFVKFDLPSVGMYVDEDDNEWFTCNIGTHRATGKTGPEAICKCALLAVLGL